MWVDPADWYDAVCCVQRGETALHMAARAGQVEVVRCLLRNGAMVDARARVRSLNDVIRKSINSFCWISFYFLWKVLILLLCPLQEDQTPLHIASRLGKTEIVQLLLQHMAHPDAATTNGYTPLHISAREGQVETASVLLEAGASHSLATKVGGGALSSLSMIIKHHRNMYKNWKNNYSLKNCVLNLNVQFLSRFNSHILEHQSSTSVIKNLVNVHLI